MTSEPTALKDSLMKTWLSLLKNKKVDQKFINMNNNYIHLSKYKISLKKLNNYTRMEITLHLGPRSTFFIRRSF